MVRFFLLYIIKQIDMQEHTEISSQTIQESSDMMIGEGYDLNSPQNIPGFKETTNFRPNYAHSEKKKKGKIFLFLHLWRKGNRNLYGRHRLWSYTDRYGCT